MLASRKSLTRRSSKLLARTMSRKSSIVTVPEEHEAYNLTGRAGSYLSMAPEVTMCQPYNEKVGKVTCASSHKYILFFKCGGSAETADADEILAVLQAGKYGERSSCSHPMS